MIRFENDSNGLESGDLNLVATLLRLFRHFRREPSDPVIGRSEDETDFRSLNDRMSLSPLLPAPLPPSPLLRPSISPRLPAPLPLLALPGLPLRPLTASSLP